LRYWAFNLLVFLSCVASGILIYLLIVGAAAGLSGGHETPSLGSSGWIVLLVVLPFCCDLFLTFAFKTPVGGLAAQVFPARRKRLREKMERNHP